MNTNEVLYFWGLNELGIVFGADKAPKDATYKCPGCGNALILRRGEVNQPHFAHKDDECAFETYEHQTAKQLIYDACLYGIPGERPVIVRKCACGSLYRTEVPIGTTPQLEILYPDGIYRADVGLFRNGEMRLGIEIHVRHYVDAVKKTALTVNTIEVEASDVIAHRGMELFPTWHNITTGRCGRCWSFQRKMARAEINDALSWSAKLIRGDALIEYERDQLRAVYDRLKERLDEIELERQS